MNSYFENSTFTLTEQHIRLLSQFTVGWQNDEFGAPEIDPKRPYGNSDVISDIHQILTGKNEEDIPDKTAQLYLQLHRELKDALQIILQTKQFTPGTYFRPAFGVKWKKQ